MAFSCTMAKSSELELLTVVQLFPLRTSNQWYMGWSIKFFENVSIAPQSKILIENFQPWCDRMHTNINTGNNGIQPQHNRKFWIWILNCGSTISLWNFRPVVCGVTRQNFWNQFNCTMDESSDSKLSAVVRLNAYIAIMVIIAFRCTMVGTFDYGATISYSWNFRSWYDYIPLTELSASGTNHLWGLKNINF